MNNTIRMSVAAAMVGLSGITNAVSPAVSVDELPILAQESQHATAAKRVSALFTRAHYKEVMLDNALSEKVFDRYLRSLDVNRNVFLESDIASLNKYRDEFDEAVERGRLDAAYAVFSVNLQRRIERYEYALSLLATPFDFEKKGDVFAFDREEAPWPKNIAELDELWRQRVKYDALNLKLNGAV